MFSRNFFLQKNIYRFSTLLITINTRKTTVWKFQKFILSLCLKNFVKSTCLILSHSTVNIDGTKIHACHVRVKSYHFHTVKKEQERNFREAHSVANLNSPILKFRKTILWNWLRKKFVKLIYFPSIIRKQIYIPFFLQNETFL